MYMVRAVLGKTKGSHAGVMFLWAKASWWQRERAGIEGGVCLKLGMVEASAGHG